MSSGFDQRITQLQNHMYVSIRDIKEIQKKIDLVPANTTATLMGIENRIYAKQGEIETLTQRVTYLERKVHHLFDLLYEPPYSDEQ
jgi:polyhydroxyalkanoate synthesis regulator phasin